MRIATLTFLTVVLACPVLQAQDSLNEAKSLSAEQIFEKCAEASGGKAKINGIDSVQMKGEASIPEFGLKGNVTASYRKGSLQVVADFNVTKTIQGITAGQGWELATTGARLMSDSETEQLIDDITLRSYANPKSVYSSMENTGIVKQDGVDCYRVKLVRKVGGKPEEILFSVKTGLPVQSTGVRQSDVGELKVITSFSDYKEFNGVTLPGHSVSKLPSVNMTYTADTQSVKYNQPIPDSAFEVPAEIKKLLADKKSN